ncbi:hypothetical protein AAFP35_00605 [Gordonia sp. CPCC 206044]|uniref:hypothetical protein n=1 Tax=Gordonia sp. CPCC 206044 TaxID=3140793 RepID=UPI003AF37CCE
MSDEATDPPEAPENPTTEILLRSWAECELDVEQAWHELEVDDDLTAGPHVGELTARLATVPGWFLTDPLRVRPLAGDVLGDGAAHRETNRVAALIDDLDVDEARTAAGLALWLWASQDVIGPYSRPLRKGRAHRVLATFAFRLAATVPLRDLIGVADRREEAARTFLLWSGQRPENEDPIGARSLLDARDSLARNAFFAEALARHQHRLEVSRQLAAARAREAASRYGSE